MTVSDPERYELLIIRHGTRLSTREEAYLNYRLYDEADRPLRLDYFFWVIRSQTRTIVIDTGFSRAAAEARGRTVLVTPERALDLLGIRPADVDTVVVTHAHYDHTGNLGLFREARIVIAAPEYAFWRSDIASRRQFSYFSEAADLEELGRAAKQGRLTRFQDRVVVAPGVEAIVVRGHTPGQAVVTFETDTGPVLIASDAVHFYEEIERDMPFSTVTDLADMYRGFSWVRDWIARTGGVLVTGHDAATFDRFARLPGPAKDFAAGYGQLTDPGEEETSR